MQGVPPLLWPASYARPAVDATTHRGFNGDSRGASGLCAIGFAKIISDRGASLTVMMRGRRAETNDVNSGNDDYELSYSNI